MITKLNIYNESVLIPRNIEGRKDKLRQETIKLLQQEVIEDHLIITRNILDIPSELVKIKVIKGNLYFNNLVLDKLPEWFSRIELITGGFTCSFNELDTLENCPQNIEGYMDCSANRLTTLQGCPKVINNNFYCCYNKLKSLQYGPKIVKGDYYCFDNSVPLSRPGDCEIEGKFDN